MPHCGRGATPGACQRAVPVPPTKFPHASLPWLLRQDGVGGMASGISLFFGLRRLLISSNVPFTHFPLFTLTQQQFRGAAEYLAAAFTTPLSFFLHGSQHFLGKADGNFGYFRHCSQPFILWSYYSMNHTTGDVKY